MTKYNLDYCNILKQEMAKGKLDVEIYSTWDICKDTFYAWRREHEEFEEAYKIGFAKCESWWIGRMRECWLNKDDKGFKYCIAIMNNKFSWGKEEYTRASTVNNIQINSIGYNQKNEQQLMEILKNKLNSMNLLEKLSDIQPDILTQELKNAIKS